MRVKDLIRQLQQCDQELEVFIWADGSRYAVTSLDDNQDDCVDLNMDYESIDLLKEAFPYALGYWQGRACGHFENGTYDNMNESHKALFKIGYDSGVADYSELDA